MEQENQMQEQNVETATTMGNDNQPEQENDVNENLDNNGEKSFNQEQVNDFVRERLNKVYKRYGVENKQGLDELVGKAQSYNIMEERYNNAMSELASLKEANAFMKNNINPNKYDDVRAYFKGKGLEFNEENLVNELQSHGEWVNVVENKPQTTIKVLGTDNSRISPQKDEKEIASRLFGMKLV